MIYGDRDALDELWTECSAMNRTRESQDWYHFHTKPRHSRFISLGNSFLPLHVRDLVPKSTDVSRRITAPLFIWLKIKFRSTSHRSFYQLDIFTHATCKKAQKARKCKLCSHLWWNSAARASFACEMPRFSTPQKPQKANKRAHLLAMIWSAAFSSSVYYLLCYTSTAQKPQANSFSNFLMYSFSTEH